MIAETNRALESRSAAAPARIFHIEDRLDDQVLFEEACRQAEVRVAFNFADSVEKAIAYLGTLTEQSRKLPVCWPDLIVLDLVLPPASGLEVLEFIQTNPTLKHIPVAVLTGHVNPEYGEESFRLGAVAFRTKPVELSELVQIAKEFYALAA